MDNVSLLQLSLACDLIRKTPEQVFKLCEKYNPVKTEDVDFYGVGYKFSSRISFFCNFELGDYQAFCSTGIQFVNNTSIECLISLGEPRDLERYSSEYEVLKTFLLSLHHLDFNARVISDDIPDRVYSWKKGNNLLITLVSHPGGIGVQIRDTELHPLGQQVGSDYQSAKKLIDSKGYVQLHLKNTSPETIFKGRKSIDALILLAYIVMFISVIAGIWLLFSKKYALGISLILLGGLCIYCRAKLLFKAGKDYLSGK